MSPRWDPVGLPAVDRVLRRVDITSGCWEFQGCRNWDGYGNVKNPGGSQRAHVVVYEALIGQIPDGHELDHLCRNPPCVNPYHCEPVTKRENQIRGNEGKHNRIKTHCPQGHPYDEANTYLYKNHRACRECSRLDNERRRAKQKVEARRGS